MRRKCSSIRDKNQTTTRTGEVKRKAETQTEKWRWQEAENVVMERAEAEDAEMEETIAWSIRDLYHGLVPQDLVKGLKQIFGASTWKAQYMQDRLVSRQHCHGKLSWTETPPSEGARRRGQVYKIKGRRLEDDFRARKATWSSGDAPVLLAFRLYCLFSRYDFIVFLPCMRLHTVKSWLI